MYSVAICDDEKSSAGVSAELLEKYKNSHLGVNFDVDIFYSSLELLGAIENKSYDIYLLDIYIDRMNGIEIAEAIKKKDESSHIIFMTSSNAFYREAFRIHAVHYLEKPILEEEFFDALDRVCTVDEIHYLSVKEGGGLTRIPASDIIYIQSEDHYKRIITDKKSFLIRDTMQGLMNELKGDQYFYLLGKNIIINLKRVLKITKDTITMDDGASFALPRGTYRNLSELVVKFSF